MKIKTNILLLIAMSLALTMCKKDDDDPEDNDEGPNEEELITDMELTFTNPEDASDSHVYGFSDPDGDGGEAPSIDTLFLTASAAYNVSISVQDASDPDNVEDITGEIQEEDEEHQFFFVDQNIDSGTFTAVYADSDENGNPVGLESTWVMPSGTSDDSFVRVILRHQPDKNGDGVSDGDPTNAGGETDIQVDFPLRVAE